MSRALVPARVANAVFAVTCTALSAVACQRYRPALFADRPAVTRIADEQPIVVPTRNPFDERLQVSDVYLRRPLFDLVHPLDFPSAGDVNALDEVPASSWYDPDGASRKGMPKVRSRGPVLPFLVLNDKPHTNDAALVVRDAAGVRYELIGDPAARRGLYTGAEMLGGYLLRSLGFEAPMTFFVRVSASDLRATEGDQKAFERADSWWKSQGTSPREVRRVSATAFPDGIDVGVTNDYSVRSDDPNDKVDHNDRRTLRALKVFGNWIGWTSFGVRQTRDVYVGAPGEGHLIHEVVGTSRAFGTGELREHPTIDEGGGSVGWNLITFGLSSPVAQTERGSRFSSLGYLPATLDPERFDVSPPYSPFVRLQPADEYWAAKRLLDAGDDALLAGMTATGWPADAARHLVGVLRRRRRSLVAHGLSVVTPLEVAGLSGHVVLLRDRAITAHFARPLTTHYDVQFLDNDGHELARRERLDAVGAVTGVRLPDGVWGRVVLHVTSLGPRGAAPRACDVHLQVTRFEARVIAVRH